MATQPVFDGHNDALTREDHDRLVEGREGGHLDLPRMRAGGMRGGIFAVFTPSPEGTRDPVAQTQAAAFASAAAGRLLALERDGHVRSPAGSRLRRRPRRRSRRSARMTTTRRTPCPDWDVAALADHLVDTIARLGAAAGLPVTVSDGGSIDARIQRLTKPLLTQWGRRGLDDEVHFAGRALPGRLALGIVCLELLIHGWDFAVALDRPYDVPDDLAEHVLGLAHQTLTEQSRLTAGFDPPVPVPADADTLDRLVALTGRDPRLRKR